MKNMGQKYQQNNKDKNTPNMTLVKLLIDENHINCHNISIILIDKMTYNYCEKHKYVLIVISRSRKILERFIDGSIFIEPNRIFSHHTSLYILELTALLSVLNNIANTSNNQQILNPINCIKLLYILNHNKNIKPSNLKYSEYVHVELELLDPTCELDDYDKHCVCAYCHSSKYYSTYSERNKDRIDKDRIDCFDKN